MPGALSELLAIVELGGYPDFTALYREAGYDVTVQSSMRRALSHLKRTGPAVIVAEFNFQSGFRDRLSNLESLMAAVQRHPGTRVIVFYEQEVAHQLERLKDRFDFHAALPFPVDPERLSRALRSGDADPNRPAPGSN